MLRIQRIAIIAALVVFAWFFALNQPTIPTVHTLIVFAPLIALVLYGAFLALWLLVGIAQFKTVPAEAELLQQDIARARKELAKRGVTL